jgi:hypothetical protein
MDIQDKAREKMNAFEKILLKIPGFKGYFEREFRRDADRLQREFIVGQLQKAKINLERIVQAVSRQKNLDRLTEYDLLARSIQKTCSEIRYADQGYSGFFDLVKIKEAELDAVYRLDGEMADLASRFCGQFDPERARDLAERGLEAPSAMLAQIDALFAKRTAMLKGYQPQGE